MKKCKKDRRDYEESGNFVSGVSLTSWKEYL
jgi:hypothetical protein